MRHAEKITDRILFLEGLPNYQRLFTLRIGQTVREQLQSDLAIELEVVERLRPGITMCREKGDHTTANLFEEILADEEHHIDYIETNLELIDRLGEQLYLAQLVDQPPTAGLSPLGHPRSAAGSTRSATRSWHDLAGDQQTRRGAAPARPRAAAPRPRPDRPGVRAAAGRRGARPRRAHVGRAPQPRSSGSPTASRRTAT